MSGTDDQLVVQEAAEREVRLDRIDVREPGQVADDRADARPSPPARRQRRSAASRGRAPRARRSRASSSTSQWSRKKPGEAEPRDQRQLLVSSRSCARCLCPFALGVALGEGALADRRAAGCRPGRARRRSRGSGSRAPAVRSKVQRSAISRVRATASGGSRSAISCGREQHRLVVAAPLALGAVERGAVADRDERRPGAGCGAGGGRGRRRSRPSARRASAASSVRARVPARVAALERPLELDVERAGKRAARARRRAFGSMTASPCRAQPERQTSPSACSATNSARRRRPAAARAPGPRPVCRRARRSGSGRGSRSRAGLAEQRHVGAAGERHLGAGDRAQRRGASPRGRTRATRRRRRGR